MYIATRLFMKVSPNVFMDDYTDTYQVERSIDVFANGSFGDIFIFRFLVVNHLV